MRRRESDDMSRGFYIACFLIISGACLSALRSQDVSGSVTPRMEGEGIVDITVKLSPNAVRILRNAKKSIITIEGTGKSVRGMPLAIALESEVKWTSFAERYFEEMKRTHELANPKGEDK